MLARTTKLVLGALLLASPPMRNALVGLDPGLPALLLLVAFGFAIASRLTPEASRRSELHLLRHLREWGWLLAILLFVSPLLAHWSQQPTSRVAAFSAQLGNVPWFDAHHHYEGALRVLATGEFGAFNERRPANASWLAVLLAVARWKLEMALLLQAALAGVLVWLASRAIALRFGLAPSLAFFSVVLGLGRAYLPTPNTETLGIALSSLGVGILVLSRGRSDPRIFALGIAASSLALAVRPGPQFLIPALIGLGLYEFRAQPRRIAILLVLAGVLGSAHGGVLNALYGSGEGSMTAYPAYTLYGLTRASNYTAVRHEIEPELLANASEEEIARVLYSRAFDNMKSDPASLALGLWQNMRKAIGKVPPSVARALSPRWLFVPTAMRVDPGAEEMAADKRWDLPPPRPGAPGFRGAALLAERKTRARTLARCDPRYRRLGALRLRRRRFQGPHGGVPMDRPRHRCGSGSLAANPIHQRDARRREAAAHVRRLHHRRPAATHDDRAGRCSPSGTIARPRGPPGGAASLHARACPGRGRGQSAGRRPWPEHNQALRDASVAGLGWR